MPIEKMSGKNNNLTFFCYLCQQINICMKKCVLFLLFIGVISISVSCSHKETNKNIVAIDTIPMMVLQIQKCSRLYSTEYHIHKIITHDDQLKMSGTLLRNKFSVNLPFGQRKIAIPLDATLKSYIDFSEFSSSSIHKKGSKIEIILPDPKIILTSTKIDHEGLKQFVPITRGKFSDEELTRYERQGRQAIINDVSYMDILETARDNAAHTLIPMVVQMGYDEKNITISFRKEFSLKDIRTLLEKSMIENGRGTV